MTKEIAIEIMVEAFIALRERGENMHGIRRNQIDQAEELINKLITN